MAEVVTDRRLDENSTLKHGCGVWVSCGKKSPDAIYINYGDKE